VSDHQLCLAEQFFFRLPFFIPKILECLLHRLAKSIPKFWRIIGEELSIESVDCSRVIHQLQRSSGTVSAVGQ
jgi:hypothetical protein